MRIPQLFLILLVIACCTLVPGCTLPEQKPEISLDPPVASISASVISPAGGHPVAAETPSTRDLIVFVDQAVDYARQNGKEKALAGFSDPTGQFSGGSISVFAGGYDGTVLADPSSPENTGKNLMNITDPYGIPFVRNRIDTARNGKGLVSYSSRNLSGNNTLQPMISYVVDVDGTYYIGATLPGNTGTEFPSTGLGSGATGLTPDDLVTFVGSAADFAKKNGKETALAAFSDQNGTFRKGEMYIIAYDLNATCLAHPYSPWIRALSLKHYTDLDSVATISGLSDVARSGGGFAHTIQRIPVDGKSVYAPKLQYVVLMDGGWWISASILNPDYAQLRSGNLTGVRTRNQAQEQLYALVNRAVQYAKENGQEKALTEIRNPGGSFVNGDLFIWAETFDGVILADPVNTGMIGHSFLNYTDPYGEKTTFNGIRSMQNGTGYSHAMFPVTVNGTTSQVPKLIYMKPVDDTWWIGSGIYGIQVT